MTAPAPVTCTACEHEPHEYACNGYGLSGGQHGMLQRCGCAGSLAAWPEEPTPEHPCTDCGHDEHAGACRGSVVLREEPMRFRIMGACPCATRTPNAADAVALHTVQAARGDQRDQYAPRPRRTRR